MDSLLRFTPCQGGLKGVERVEEPVGGWQRDLVNEILRRRDSTPVEGGYPARENVDEAVQLRVGECPVDVSVSFRGVAIEVVRAENDFQRATATHQMWETFRSTAPRMQSDSNFGLTQARVFARRKPHVASEHKLAARASNTAANLGDTNHWRSGDTYKRIREDRKT